MPRDLLIRPRIEEYPAWERSALIERLGQVVTQLVNYLQDYYRMQGDEARTKAEAWMASTETTVAGRQRDVELSTYHVTASVLEVRGEIEALKIEHAFILTLLGEHGA